MKIVEISSDIAKNILGLSKLPERNLCSSLEAVFVDNELCEGVYTISQNRIGEKSVFGEVYQACCKKNCDFVAKWQALGGKHKKTKEDILKEVEIQSIASKNKLAPSIQEVWICPEGIIIIMEALKITASRDLKTLSEQQLYDTILYYKNVFDKKIKETEMYVKKSDFSSIKKSIDKENLGKLSFQDLKDIRRDINKFCYTYGVEPLDDIYVIGEDSNEDKKIKKDILKSLLDLLKQLHSLGIVHGDTHLNNFMKMIGDNRYYLIDFGESKINPTEQDVKKDFLRLKRDVEELSSQHRYTNLDYLAELFD